MRFWRRGFDHSEKKEERRMPFIASVTTIGDKPRATIPNALINPIVAAMAKTSGIA